MLKYIYNKLKSYRLKASTKFKINIWSILNPKHTSVKTRKLLFFVKNLAINSYTSIETLTNFLLKNQTFLALLNAFTFAVFVFIFLSNN